MDEIKDTTKTQCKHDTMGRLDWIYVLRGIGMVSILALHCGILKPFCGGMQMFLMTMCVGATFRISNPDAKKVKHKIKHSLKLLVLWALVINIPLLGIEIGTLNAVGLILGLDVAQGPLWYLQLVINLYILLYTVNKPGTSRELKYTLGIMGFIVANLLPYEGIYYIFNIKATLLLYIFAQFGYDMVYKVDSIYNSIKGSIETKNKSKRLGIKFLVYIVAIVTALIFNQAYSREVWVKSGKLYNTWYDIIISIVEILIIVVIGLMLSVLGGRVKVLLGWLGKNSLTLMIFHNIQYILASLRVRNAQNISQPAMFLIYLTQCIILLYIVDKLKHRRNKK